MPASEGERADPRRPHDPAARAAVSSSYERFDAKPPTALPEEPIVAPAGCDPVVFAEHVRALRAQMTAGANAVRAARVAMVPVPSRRRTQARTEARTDSRTETRAEETTLLVGARAEALAVEALCARGYRIVERNFRIKAGELDVIAVDGDVLVFVEVRSRADDEHGSALEAVGPRKRRQVARVAGWYLGLRQPPYAKTRFDVVGVTGERVELVRDAWRIMPLQR